MKKKILISTGGSGGHVIPALNFFEHLKEDHDIFISTDLRGSKFIDPATYKKEIIDVPDIKKNIFKVPINIIFFIISIIKSFMYLKKNKINQIISTGGYMTLPICIASKFTKSKLFLFEPNMVLGRSNLFFINQCQKIFCYSDNIMNFPERHKYKIQIIYPMIKKKSYSLKKVNYKDDSRKIILIIGGSQGANFFQIELKEIINKLSKKYNLFIYHQTNKHNFKNLEFFYEKNKIDYKLFDFDHSLDNIIKKTNFCITRAGASTLAELVYFQVPFLAIPFPYSKDNHQFYNAKFYMDKNCCWLIEQKNISKTDFFEFISHIINDEKDTLHKKNAMRELSKQNTWENNNKIILQTINEN